MDSQQITTTVGKQFDVHLTAVATGGYQWQVQDLPPEIRSEGSDRTAKSNLPGAPLEQVFHFVASKPGAYTIQLIYKRSWEPTIENTQTVKVTVQ
jgi:predicted secreted protein